MFRASGHRTDRPDPRETVDYFYQTELEKLQRLRRMVNEMATSRKRIELQINSSEQQEKQTEARRDAAEAAGRKDLAEEAETRIAAMERNIQSLRKQYDKAMEREEEGTLKAQAMQSLVDSFRINKETFKADYSIAVTETPEPRDLPGRGKLAGDEIDDDSALRLAAITDLLSPDLMDAGQPHDQDQ
jgi:phage shock protein A